jgi:hypothetical protein
MEVYLVPVGADRHELYCETAHEVTDPDRPRGYFARLHDRFRAVVDHVERERHQPAPLPSPGTGRIARLLARARRGSIRWIAEKIAEQRVLWQLGGERNVVAVVPDDLDPDAALAILHGMLARDASRHGRWLIVNAIAFVLSGVLTPIPGPNLVAYYFAFRVVGHYLSRRGARDGLISVEWEVRRSADLSDLRRAISLGPADRERHVRAVAARLRLLHLAAFFDRTVLPTT